MLINDLKARIAGMESQINDAFQLVITSGWVVLGPIVRQFEADFASYIGNEYCVSLANGTDAIELGLKAMGVGVGDLVATVANAGMYTTTAVLAIGAEPFFIDVDLVTRNTTLSEVDRAISAGVKAVVVTHLYGLAAPEICEIAQHCSRANVGLLEDCAQAHGAIIAGQRVGAFGDVASFSFYPTKNLGALGDGGAVVTNNVVIAEKVIRLRQYGWTEKYTVEFDGARNSRLDEMQAAILRVFLPRLDEANALRRDIAKRYSAAIKHPDVFLPKEMGGEYVAHLYVISSPSRDSLRAHLRKLDIASEVHYPTPDYRQPVFGGRYANLRFENTEQLAGEVLTLPCYPEMTDEQVDQVIAAVNSWRP